MKQAITIKTDKSYDRENTGHFQGNIARRDTSAYLQKVKEGLEVGEWRVLERSNGMRVDMA